MIDLTGYAVVTQTPTEDGATTSYAVFRLADGVGIGAYFDMGDGGDVDVTITADRATHPQV